MEVVYLTPFGRADVANSDQNEYQRLRAHADFPFQFCRQNKTSSRGDLFIRRRSIVCLEKSDIVKVAASINTLRHLAQIRALVNQKRCRISTRRREIIDIGHTERFNVFEPAQVRTQDKPEEKRWVLRKDVGVQVR